MFKWIVDFFVAKPVQEEKKELCEDGATAIAVKTNGNGDKFYAPVVFDRYESLYSEKKEVWYELYYYVNKETQEEYVTSNHKMPNVFERQYDDYKDEEKAKKIIDIYLKQEHRAKMARIVKVDYVRYP